MGKGSSKYLGVYFNNADSRWVVEMERYPNHPCFIHERDAAIYAEYHYRKIYNQSPNFPDLSDDSLETEYKEILIRRTQEIAETNSAARQGIKRNQHKTSKYVGVFLKEGSRWCARIQHKGKSIHVASYSINQEDAEEKAVRAYDLKALELYGEQARTNFDYSHSQAPSK